MQSGRRTRQVQFGALVFLVWALVLTGCGIALQAGDAETEFFKGLDIQTTDITPGARVAFTLDYAQLYTVPVDIRCDVLAGDQRLVNTPVATAAPTPTLTKFETPTSLPLPLAKNTPKSRVLEFSMDTVQPNLEGGPVGEATPTLGTLNGGFEAPPRPGKYTLRCFTPQDEGNALLASFTILSAATPEP